MRKIVVCLLMALLLFVCAPALAETYVFDAIYASVEVPDGYIVLTPSNLDNYAEWLISRGTSAELARTDFDTRGVLMQVWSEEFDTCMELTAVQSDRTQMIFDVNEQDESARRSYRLGHYPNNDYVSEGYNFTSADWKNTNQGRFLILRYSKRDGGEVVHRGLMRRTIRNGYEITFDWQVFDRSTTNRDNNNLNTIWNTFNFIEVLPLPPAAAAKINITEAPPEETNEQSFTMEGTAAEGVHFTAVVMGLTYPEPILSEVTVPRNGRFRLPITLPREGVFMVTVTAEHQGVDVVELAYPVTYQRTLLTVNIPAGVPTVVTEDELTISGTSEPGATIQVFVNSEAVGTRRVNTAGRFTVDIDTDQEGEYEILLVFNRSGLADRRLTYHVTRQWTDADMIAALQREAVRPSYNNLINRMEGYEGRTMGYSAYFVDISQSGDEWIARMALRRQREEYSNIILVICKDEPTFSVGDRVTMYGTCAGMSISTETEDGSTEESYPCFELLLFVAEE